MKVNREDIIKKLVFALNVIYAIDMLAKYENNPVQAGSAIAIILIELGYSKEDSYSVAVLLERNNKYDMLNYGDINIMLPSLVEIAANYIDHQMIPDYIREQVRTTLATQ